MCFHSSAYIKNRRLKRQPLLTCRYSLNHTEEPRVASEPNDELKLMTWPRRALPPKPWAEALAEEYKIYPWEEDVEFGEDATLWDPYFGDPTGSELLRREAVLALRQLERRRWVYFRETDEIVQRPDPEVWRKYRGPPGQPVSDVDPAGVGNLVRRDALRRLWNRILQEECDAEKERKSDGTVSCRLRTQTKWLIACDAESYDPGADEFHNDVWFDGPSGWNQVRRYVRMAAASTRNIHKEALLAKGWWIAEEKARNDREKEEGIVYTKLEQERQYFQRIADHEDYEDAWVPKKMGEMRLWRAIEEESKKQN